MISVSDLKGWLRRSLGQDASSTPDRLAVTAKSKTAGTRVIEFDTSSNLAKAWFYPRYLDGGLHEPPIAQWLIDRWSADSCFIDVGANVGFYSMLAAAFCDQGSVISVEMDPRLIQEILRSAERNDFRNLQVVSCAASEATGKLVQFQAHQEGNLSTNQILPESNSDDSSPSKLAAMCLTLDDLVNQLSVQPDLMKIDVEGHENRVLKGMANTIRRLQGLAIEVHDPILNNEAEYDFFQRTLLDSGFDCEAVIGHRGQTEFLRLQADSDWASLQSNTMILCERRS